MVEEYIWRTRADDLVGEKGEWSIDNTLVIIFHFTFPAAFVIFDYSIMSDVSEILENDRTKTAKLLWCCKSRTSLFGWTYMKIKVRRGEDERTLEGSGIYSSLTTSPHHSFS